MSTKPKQPVLSGTLARLNEGKTATWAAIALLKELGLKADGSWCFQSTATLERIAGWWDHAPLYIRALAIIQRHTLAYLPTSGGVWGKPGSYRLLDSFGFCKKHGALLAVAQAKGGRKFPIGPSYIRNEINAAGVHAYEAQVGRQATPEEVEMISVPATHIRYALSFLEDLGLCLRTDAEDTPLAELSRTAEGRKKVKSLSGENKIRVYLYLHPRPAKVGQGSNTLLPSNANLQKLQSQYKRFLTLQGVDKETINRVKPLYHAVLAVKLNIEPAAFLADTELQHVVQAQIEERERLITTCDEQLRSAVLARYPSAADETISAVPNSNGEEAGSVLPPPPAVASKPAGTVEAMGAEMAMVSQPRQRNTAPAKTEEELPRPRAKTAAELAPVAAAMAAVELVDRRVVSQVFGNCRDEVSDCTPEEVAAFVHRTIQKGKQVGNWERYLLGAIDDKPKSPGFAAWCQQERGFAAAERKPGSMERKSIMGKGESYAERKAREIIEQRKAEGKVSNG